MSACTLSSELSSARFLEERVTGVLCVPGLARPEDRDTVEYDGLYAPGLSGERGKTD